MRRKFFTILLLVSWVTVFANDGFGIRGSIRRTQTAKLNLRQTSFLHVGGSFHPYDIGSDVTLGWAMASRINILFATQVAQYAKNDITGTEPPILAPMDFSLAAKFGGIQFLEKKLTLTGEIYFFPQGKAPYNLPLLPYRSEKISIGGKLLTSYYTRPGYFLKNIGFHLNLGAIYHNNAGVVEGQIDSLTTEFETTTEGLFGFGILYPFMIGAKAFEAGFEVYGNRFMTQPNAAVYSRENYAYVNLQLRMGLFNGINLDLGGSFLVLNEKDITNYTLVRQPTDVTTNYTPWVVTMGVEVDFHRLFSRTYLSQEDFQEQVITKFDQLLSRKTTATTTSKEEVKKVEDKKEPANIKKLAEQRKSAELELEAKVRAVQQGIPLKAVNAEESSTTPPPTGTEKPK